MQIYELFTLEYALLWGPVFFVGGIALRIAYASLIDALLPWKDFEETPNPRTGWIADERRQLETRRSEERRALARAAYLRGDPTASALIGRRASDYIELGLPVPAHLKKSPRTAPPLQ